MSWALCKFIYIYMGRSIEKSKGTVRRVNRSLLLLSSIHLKNETVEQRFLDSFFIIFFFLFVFLFPCYQLRSYLWTTSGIA